MEIGDGVQTPSAGSNADACRVRCGQRRELSPPDAAFTPREERVAIRHTATMMRMGELAACELAKQELASRSPGTCQTHFGSRTDIRNLTARTQFNGGTWICHCRDAGLFMQCDVSGDAVCAFEEATSRCVQGQG
jgi:hypothetical protein